MRYLRELDRDYLQDKTCLLRVDLNITDPGKETLRLNAIVPTIRFLLDKGAKPLIISHRGRPKGHDPKLSLQPLIKTLEKKVCEKLDWLENLRFDSREQKNDESYAEELAGKADFFVNDAFAVSHRANTSVAAITKFLPSFAGLLMEKEVKTLSQVRDEPKQPLVIIIGGIKIDDKIEVIDNLNNKTEYFLMGSAYNKLISNKLISSEPERIIFPLDFSDDKKLDIGPKTIQKYSDIIKDAETIIWNGPLGKFEDKKYIGGSENIAQAIVDSHAFSVVGGGDTNQLLNELGLEDEFGFVSTGGGAMLNFLAGKKLPGVEALNNNEK